MKVSNIKQAAVLALVLLLVAPQLVVSQKRSKLTEEQRIVHVLNRLGFGARPGDVQRVKAMGLENYINQQLAPERIDDAVAENKVKDLGVLNMTTAELYEKFPQPGRLLRQLQDRGLLPKDLAEAREDQKNPRENAEYRRLIEE